MRDGGAVSSGVQSCRKWASETASVGTPRFGVVSLCECFSACLLEVFIISVSPSYHKLLKYGMVFVLGCLCGFVVVVD